MQRNAKTFTTIVSCTDDDQTMEYLNNWDLTIPRLDVIDDFRNEKLEILRSQGSNFKFSFGDYIVKSLIGSIDPEMDNMDERRAEMDNMDERRAEMDNIGERRAEMDPLDVVHSKKYWLIAVFIAVLCLAFAYLFFKMA
jgi:hypothetical protein